MKTWQYLVPLPLVAALAMIPQDAANPGDPALVDQVSVVSLAELQYTNLQGAASVVSSRNVVEIRLFDDHPHSIRLELLYENGDYSLIDAQSFHLLRLGNSTREVRLVRGKSARMRFPRLP